MEITSKFQERENYSSPLNSPAGVPGGSYSRSNMGVTINGGGGAGGCNGGGNSGIQSPIPVTRSDPNHPYPTTFVTADTCTFKQVVQSLTGLPESSKNNSPKPQQQQPQPPLQYHHQIQPQDQNKYPPQPQQQPPPLQYHHQIQSQDHNNNYPPQPPSRNYIIPPIKTAPKKQGFKLYERRNSLKNNLMISPLNYTPNFIHSPTTSSFSPRKPEILSPSLLDFPSLRLSPVTPLLSEDPFDKSSSTTSMGNCSSSSSEEEKAIAEKGFYLHKSPMSTPRETEPQLLPLFPVTSPRLSESSSSSAS